MKKERICRKGFSRFLAIFLILAIFAATYVTASADQSPVGCLAYVVNASKLNLREKPQGEILVQIPSGEVLTILSERDRNGYYYVQRNATGKKYYAYGEYLKIDYSSRYQAPSNPTYNENSNSNDDDENPEWKDRILVVTSDKKLNLRKRSNQKAPRIKYLEYGDRLQVVSTRINNNYILVRDLQDGKVGYVDISYVVFESDFQRMPQPCNCCPECTGFIYY